MRRVAIGGRYIMTTTSPAGVQGSSFSPGASPVLLTSPEYLAGCAQATIPRYARVCDKGNNVVASISTSGCVQPMSGATSSFNTGHAPSTRIRPFISEDQNDAEFNDGTIFLRSNLYSG